MLKYLPYRNVKCPHCGILVQLICDSWISMGRGVRQDIANPVIGPEGRSIEIGYSRCPSCDQTIVEMGDDQARESWLIYPRTASRGPVHPDVPTHIKEDYNEAAMVLSISPKASAALARRCLQSLLVEQGAKKDRLYDQLGEVYDSLPAYVQSYVDNVRKLGNIAAHAHQSQMTGEIVPVEPGEAEWILELLDELFDHLTCLRILVAGEIVHHNFHQ